MGKTISDWLKQIQRIHDSTPHRPRLVKDESEEWVVDNNAADASFYEQKFLSTVTDVLTALGYETVGLDFDDIDYDNEKLMLSLVKIYHSANMVNLDLIIEGVSYRDESQDPVDAVLAYAAAYGVQLGPDAMRTMQFGLKALQMLKEDARNAAEIMGLEQTYELPFYTMEQKLSASIPMTAPSCARKH